MDNEGMCEPNMTVSFFCNSCGTKVSCTGTAAGSTAICPDCGCTLALPLAAAKNQRIVVKSSSPNQSAISPDIREMIEHRRNVVVIIETGTGIGTGVAVSDDGLVVTNAHVVEADATYSVTAGSGQTTLAVCVHRHPRLDLAVVKLKDRVKCFLDLRRECASDIEAGDDVIAIGHPLGLRFTSTRGIVSSPSRLLDDGTTYVQTDVAISPGNSGGPLLTTEGKLVGLNTMVFTESSGLGFAIPAFEVAQYVRSVQHLLRSGELAEPGKAGFEHPKLGPIQVVEAALQALGLPAERETLDSGSLSWISSEGIFAIFLGEDYLTIYANITTLTDDEAMNPWLLLHLLRRNFRSPVAFYILETDEGRRYLSVGTTRSLEGIDTSEVVYAVSAVIDAAQTSVYLTDAEITGTFGEIDHELWAQSEVNGEL